MSDRERILREEIPPCNLVKEEEETTWSGATGGWTMEESLLTPGFALYPVWTGTIDLSGYAMDYKTFYPSGATTQASTIPFELFSDGLRSYTVVSTVPLDAQEVITTIQSLSAPGMIQLDLGVIRIPGHDWETIMFAETELFVPDNSIVPNTVGVLRPLARTQTGSLEPTAADTLFIMKVFIGLNAFQDSRTLVIPASRVIIPGFMDQEPDLEYMMRLKRSLELANQV